ncbi:MAG: hypothetical protein IAF00_08675 [Phycisphaerales bacterium]|nr:hypothetical protein [Phycisphaerales bacterium]
MHQIANNFYKTSFKYFKNIFSFNFFLIISAALIIYLKAPNIIIFPRFWAEEGTVHFKFAYENNLIDNILFVYWKVGYYNLFTNFATEIASLISLTYAPFITTGFAFVVQLIPYIILLTGNSYLFDKEYKKIFGFLALAFLPSMIGEIWLNTINSQIWFGLIGLLLLFENFEKISNQRKYFYRSLFFIGGLTGLYSLVFYPLFAVKVILERNKEIVICFFILTITLFIQLYIFYLAMDFNLLNEKRFSSIGTQSIQSIFFSQFTASIIGKNTNLIFILIITISFFYICIPINKKDKISIALFLSWFGMAAFTILGSFHGNPGGRYAIISGYIVLFYLIHNLNYGEKKSILITFMLLIAILIGFFNYINKDIALQCDGKNWNNEVKIFLGDKKYKLSECPRKWKIKFDP